MKRTSSYVAKPTGQIHLVFRKHEMLKSRHTIVQTYVYNSTDVSQGCRLLVALSYLETFKIEPQGSWFFLINSVVATGHIYRTDIMEKRVHNNFRVGFILFFFFYGNIEDYNICTLTLFFYFASPFDLSLYFFPFSNIFCYRSKKKGAHFLGLLILRDPSGKCKMRARKSNYNIYLKAYLINLR